MTKIVDLTPVGHYGVGQSIYSFSTSFPSRNVRAVGPTFPTPEAAIEEGIASVKRYEADDPYGNMGEVIGATRVEHGFRAVINTYHSNT